MLVLGLAVSLLLIVAERLFPSQLASHQLTQILEQLNFSDIVLHGLLAFLLFAGAYNVNLAALRERAWHIAFLATAGTMISIALVATATYYASRWLGPQLPLGWCLVFGALISPTDPVAVLSSLKNYNVPQALEAKMKGEALFNDGVGIVFFIVFLEFVRNSAENPGALDVLSVFLREAGGGLMLGLILGYVAYLSLRQIDDFSTEMLITLALVTSSYSLANWLQVSGPLSVVAAGLLVGSRGRRYAMTDMTEKYVTAVWTLIDEILNAVLFMLIGLEVLIVPEGGYPFLLAAISIPVVLLARAAALGLPTFFFLASDLLTVRNVPFLTWAGVRGGISVALALSLPGRDESSTLLSMTYAVVLFSIIVQGSTIGYAARRTLRRDASTDA